MTWIDWLGVLGVVFIIGFLGFWIGRGTAPTIKLSDEATYHQGFADGVYNQKQIGDYECKINTQATPTILMEKQKCDEMGGILNIITVEYPEYVLHVRCDLPQKRAFEIKVKFSTGHFC